MSSGVFMSAVTKKNFGAQKPKANVENLQVENRHSLADWGLNTRVRSFRIAPRECIILVKNEEFSVPGIKSTLDHLPTI